MSKRELDQSFLDQQKRRLLALRGELLAVRQREQSEERGVNAEVIGQAHDYEDDAQRLDAIDVQEDLLAVNDIRLGNVERALQKMAEGTYGLSDAGGAPISLERLEATPEALYTEEEQRRRERA
jgi:DnaK suppressor protein